MFVKWTLYIWSLRVYSVSRMRDALLFSRRMHYNVDNEINVMDGWFSLGLQQKLLSVIIDIEGEISLLSAVHIVTRIFS